MYNVSVSPHIRDKSNTTKIMLDVCIALAPTLIFGVCHHFKRCQLCFVRGCF